MDLSFSEQLHKKNDSYCFPYFFCVRLLELGNLAKICMFDHFEKFCLSNLSNGASLTT